MDRLARNNFDLLRLVFAGTVGALALGGPRWLGAVTPLGGSLMIFGFLLFAWAALRA